MLLLGSAWLSEVGMIGAWSLLLRAKFIFIHFIHLIWSSFVVFANEDLILSMVLSISFCLVVELIVCNITFLRKNGWEACINVLFRAPVTKVRHWSYDGSSNMIYDRLLLNTRLQLLDLYWEWFLLDFDWQVTTGQVSFAQLKPLDPLITINALSGNTASTLREHFVECSAQLTFFLPQVLRWLC
jgi:hypothetical protein